MYCCILVTVILFIVYKVFDRLVRLPRILGPLSNRYILVTGCDTGFGHEFVKRLDRRGCHVFASCFSEKGEDELKKQCSWNVKTFSLDVSSHDSVLQAYEFVKQNLPQGKGLWGVVNNAGIKARHIGPCEWLTLDDYRDALAVNTLGLIDVTMTFLPLIKKERGRIVNTSSMYGRTTITVGAPYGISKHGVEVFSDCLRRQLRRYSVTVHIIEPGFFKTEIINVDSSRLAIREGFAQAPPDIQREYGDSAPAESIYYMEKVVLAALVNSRVDDVIDAYEDAVLGMYPRARYVVGNDAKYLMLPLQCLPEWFSDWFQDKMFPKLCVALINIYDKLGLKE